MSVSQEPRSASASTVQEETRHSHLSEGTRMDFQNSITILTPSSEQFICHILIHSTVFSVSECALLFIQCISVLNLHILIHIAIFPNHTLLLFFPYLSPCLPYTNYPTGNNYKDDSLQENLWCLVRRRELVPPGESSHTESHSRVISGVDPLRLY